MAAGKVNRTATFARMRGPRGKVRAAPPTMSETDLHPAATPGAERIDRVIDTTGLYCPVPIVRTGEAIRSLREGDRLEVLSDDRVILVDMPAWCRSHGHVYEGARDEGVGVWRLRVRKARRGAR